MYYYPNLRNSQMNTEDKTQTSMRIIYKKSDILGEKAGITVW